jgi:uncharacterized protein (DUF924 family)
MAAPDAPATTAADVLAFWTSAGRQRWYRKDDAFDAEFRARFLPAHETAARGALAHWADGAEGALALLVLLDQFPRNAFRGSPRTFATDALARNVADAALARGFDHTQADPDLRNFFYLPFMHSEWLPDQDRALHLCQQLGTDAVRHARIHRDIVERFGRFPHRNALLGRFTTAEERAFLEGGGFGG